MFGLLLQGLTLANPITILSFIAIFAGTSPSGTTTSSSSVIVLGIAAGSMLWWLLLSFIIGFIRSTLQED